MKLRQYRKLKQAQMLWRLMLTPEVFWGPYHWTLIEGPPEKRHTPPFVVLGPVDWTLFEDRVTEWRNGFPKSWAVDDRPSKRNIPDQ